MYLGLVEMRIGKRSVDLIHKIIKWTKINFLNYNQFDFLIGPEIKNDIFYHTIQKIAQDKRFKNFLEIGSSSGQGSTSAFVSGIDQRSDVESVRFFCIELSNQRFKKLKSFYKEKSYIKVYNISSVSVAKFPSFDDVRKFYNNRKTNLNDASIEEIRNWYDSDIQYILDSGKNIDGISAIKNSINLNYFDVVLIDGSEFTGIAELNAVIGAAVILLDDTESYKCREAFERLAADPAYRLYMYEPKLRGGFAIYSKLDLQNILDLKLA